MSALLEISNLSVEAKAKAGDVRLIDGINLQIAPGEALCLVGESGSGKSLTALTITRLAEYRGAVPVSGEIRFAGQELRGLSQTAMSALRGRGIGLVFQEPMTAFDPLLSIGAQISEVLIRHRQASRSQAMVQAVELLTRVHVPDPALRAGQLPHELSGGLLQRATIALALACRPKLLIADEPTTALDVTIQAQILDLLVEIKTQSQLSVLLITHDLGVAARIADRIAVMYAGRIAETGPAQNLLQTPAHPYTRGLLQAVVGLDTPPGASLAAIAGNAPDARSFPPGCRFHPRCALASAICSAETPGLQQVGAGLAACWHAVPALPEKAWQQFPKPRLTSGDVLLEAQGLRRHYQVAGKIQKLHAVDEVSLQIRQGEIFGLVGESGSGKSSLARLLLGLEKPDAGTVRFAGKDLAKLAPAALRRLRRDMQMIFQDPYGSLDPRWSIGESIGEPLRLHEKNLTRAELNARVTALLTQVGLEPGWAKRLPRQLSGGQRQRVAIARALALQPRFIVADEAVAALDVSVRAQIINLLLELRAALSLTCLFISHDLALTRHVADRVGVMYLGEIVEIGPAEGLFRQPAHPYTRALLAAAPDLNGAPAPHIGGDIPSPMAPPSGCRFHTRCPLASSRCGTEAPILREQGEGRAAACHYPLQ